MLSSTDHDKLQQIIQEHPETEELFNRIFKSHQMDISTISHEIRNPPSFTARFNLSNHNIPKYWNSLTGQSFTRTSNI